MPTDPSYISLGAVKRQINVALSYKIVRLFSEGLYQSANKAFEELVTNSFDAEALKVNVVLASDATAPGATLIVADDGEGMDINGLEDLWLVGASKKREPSAHPRKRRQIGKFGIGKLSTYVLASKLTYVCKRRGKFYAVSMDYSQLDAAADSGIATSTPVILDVRELSQKEAQSAVSTWTSNPLFMKWGVRLFGAGSRPSWTFAILSALKRKASEIVDTKLEWILRTALPLRDDFEIWLNGKQLKPSNRAKGRAGQWVLGKQIKKLTKPAPANIVVRKDATQPDDSEHYYGLYHPRLGRVTGYAEAYRDVLTSGKSTNVGRSHGFFVYVLGRLVNIDDPYFGIPSNRLAHGTFERMRVVVHIDKLDEDLQSDREGVREGPVRIALQEFLQGVFNVVRTKLKTIDDRNTPGRRMAGRFSGSPASLTRRPIVALAAAALAGEAKPRYTKIPTNLPPDKKSDFIQTLSERSETPDEFIRDVQLSSALSPEDGIAVYDTESATLHINCLHPFVSAFSSDFFSSSESLPLELMAMAEVLLEAQLYYLGFRGEDVGEIVSGRDELLRNLAKTSGRRNARLISQALRDARLSQDQLEEELVACFDSLGFEASRIGGSGHADGVAHAYLSPDEARNVRRYSVSLEAKSKEQDGKKVSAKTVGVSTVARHRNNLKCQHAVVVGPDFPTTKGDTSALAEEISEDRDKNQDGRTITLITVDDMARLVRIAPIKQLMPSQLRDLFQTCSLPEESREWIDALGKKKVKKPPYKALLETIWVEQKDDQFSSVKYAALRVLLRDRKDIQMDESGIKDLCANMEAMAPGIIAARKDSVEMEAPPKKVLAMIEVATRESSEDEADLA